MPLSPEMITKINRRAKKIEGRHTREIAEAELAEVKFEEWKANIRNSLSALNDQIAGNDQLRQSLSTVLQEHKDYKCFRGIAGSGSISGIPIAAGSGQTAVFTSDGVIVIEKRIATPRWTPGLRYYYQEYFVPLKLEDASVEELFPNLGPAGALDKSSQILQSLLSSSGKK